MLTSFTAGDRANSDLSSNTFDAIIIGAGISGLGAALKLTQSGLNILILEARDRLGGRINSINLDDKTIVDLGANWRHVNEGNPLNKFLTDAKYNLQLILDSTEEKIKTNTLQFTKNNGHKYSPEEIFILIGKYVAMLEAFPVLAQYMDFNKSYSIADVIKLYCDKTNNEKIRDDLLFVATLCTCAELANDLTNLPFANILDPNGDAPFCALNQIQRPNLPIEYYNIQPEDHMVLGGYDKIINSIIDHINQDSPGKLTIIKNAAVKQIDYTHAQKTKVTTNDATVYYASFGVISTLPIGVLQNIIKKQPHFFNPDLTDDKKQAILRAKQGSANKVIIKFNSPIMQAELNGFFAKPASNELCPTQWYNLAYYDTKNNYNLNSTLMGIYYGKKAEFSNKSDEDILQEALGELSEFLNIPVQKLRDNISTYHITHWEDDEYARGAWDTYTIQENPTDRLIIQEPMNKLFFAGDHLSPCGASTHGAFISGQAAATSLLKNLEQKNIRKFK